MYVNSAQFCDKQDINWNLIPIVLITGLSAFAGFVASSALLAEATALRSCISLASGLGGVLATGLTAVKNANKLDIKAEMFRGAAGQYRLLATRLEQRIRTHRNAMMLESWKDPRVRDAEVAEFNKFFADNYSVLLTAQSEMKFFPPSSALKLWKKAKQLLPNEIDQPDIDRSDIIKVMDQFT